MDLPEYSPQDESSREILPSPTGFSDRVGQSPVAYALIALLVVFILYQVVGGTITLLIFGVKMRPGTVQWMRLATMLGQILLILLPTIVLTHLQGFGTRQTLRLRGTGSREILLAVVGVLSLQQILQVYLVLQDQIPIPTSIQPLVDSIREAIEETYRELTAAHSVPELFYVLLVIALVPAVCEELLFRGLVQRNFERGVKGWWKVIIPGIIFGAYHFNPFSFVPLAVLGVYLGFLVLRSESIVTPMAAHFANNLFAVVVVFFNGDEAILPHDDMSGLSFSALSSTVAGFGLVFVLSMYAFVKITHPTESAPAQ
jgi:membrane protease YdiL (CAAX protease family)